MNKSVSDLIEADENDTIVDAMLSVVLIKKLGLLMDGFSDDLGDLLDIVEEISEQGIDI